MANMLPHNARWLPALPQVSQMLSYAEIWINVAMIPPINHGFGAILSLPGQMYAKQITALGDFREDLPHFCFREATLYTAPPTTPKSRLLFRSTTTKSCATHYVRVSDAQELQFSYFLYSFLRMSVLT